MDDIPVVAAADCGATERRRDRGMETAMPKYECDKCGACCKHPIIEIEWVDYLREPKLREASTPFRHDPNFEYQDEDGNPIEITDPYMLGGILACGGNMPCKMLGDDNLCTIYPTRPGCCVLFEAGTELCQSSRAAAHLPPLEPVADEVRA